MRALRRDPRDYQISILSLLLGYGLVFLDFDVSLGRIAAVLATAQLTQWLCTRAFGLARFDPKSALISSLSLCILLRTNDTGLAMVAMVIAIASKFLLRFDGRHVFNPTALALVVMVLVTDRAWVSPGLWGSSATFGFGLACLGALVVNRASRSDVTLAFLTAYAAVLLGRALWLGDPLSIPLHQLQNGALLLFAFFMISDPKTTPDARIARIAFATLVALGSGLVHFALYENNGFLWSLVALAPTVPMLNRIRPARAFEWNAVRRPHDEGRTHETVESDPAPARGCVAA